MKYSKLFQGVIIGLMSLATLVSCTVESPFESETESEFLPGATEQVKVSVKDFIISDLDNPEETKTNLIFGGGALDFTWAETDTIGIFPNSAKTQIPFPMAAGVGTKNALFDGGGWFVEGGASYLAYYPFDGRMYHKNYTVNANFNNIIQRGNNSTDHLGAVDYMGVRAVGSNDKNISFAFDHLCSVLIFRMTVPKATTYTKLSLETNQRIFVKRGGINLLAALLGISPIETSKTYSIGLSGIKTNAPNVQITVYVPLAPIDLSGKNVTLRLTGPNVNYSTTFQLNKAFEAGHAYQKTITFSSSGTVSKIVSGELFNTMVKGFVAGAERTLDEYDYDIEHIVFQPKNEEVLVGVPRIDISDSESSVPIYAYWKADENKLIVRSEQAIYAASDCFNMFHRFGGLLDIDLNGLDLYYTRRLERFFSECRVLSSVDLRPLDTKNVTNFRRMFIDCNAMTSVDLSSFDTSGMDDMYQMFRYCYALESLDLSSFSTDKLKGLAGTFTDCHALASITFGDNFHTDKVGSFHEAFMGCTSLTTLDLSSFDTSNSNDFSFMFCGCDKLETIVGDIEVTDKVENLNRMFDGCSELESIGVGNWDTSNVSGMYGVFRGCGSLNSLDVSQWQVGKATTFEDMFNGCAGISTLDLRDWETWSVTSMAGMFQGCSSLQALDLDNFVTANVTNMEGLFYGCHALETLSMANFNTSNVTTMESMFWECKALTTLDVSMFDTSKVLTMKRMFNDCFELESIVFNPTTFNTARCQDMNSMFLNSHSLLSLDLSFFNTDRVRDMGRMFELCSALQSLDISSFTVTHLEDGCGGFLSSCYNLQTINFGSSFIFPDNWNYMYLCGRDLAVGAGTITCSSDMATRLDGIATSGEWYQWNHKDRYVINTL